MKDKGKRLKRKEGKGEISVRKREEKISEIRRIRMREDRDVRQIRVRYKG